MKEPYTYAPDTPTQSLSERLDARVQEMKDRQRRLTASGPRRKSKRTEEQKQIVIRGFSASQLESMLSSSTKNVAQEVVACLISRDGKGVLTDIIRWLASTASGKSELKSSEELSQKKLVTSKRPHTTGKS